MTDDRLVNCRFRRLGAFCFVGFSRFLKIAQTRIGHYSYLEKTREKRIIFMKKSIKTIRKSMKSANHE